MMLGGFSRAIYRVLAQYIRRAEEHFPLIKEPVRLFPQYLAREANLEFIDIVAVSQHANS